MPTLAHGASFNRGVSIRAAQRAQPILVKERLFPKDGPTEPPPEYDMPAAGQGGVDHHKAQDDYNKETKVVVPWADKSSLPVTVEGFIAILWITMVASLPLISGILEGSENITKTQLVQFAVMWIVFFSGVYLFANVLYFQSIHFETIRRLTIVESVYLMSQILTTVGYGDITPAKPRGQVFVAFYVLFSLLVLANVVSEAAELITARAKEAIAKFKARQNAATANPYESEEGDESQIVSSRFFDKGPPPVDASGLKASGAFYFVMVVIGVIFFRLYPGEGKTVFQGVYMSVITLSTVGFGAFTPVTEGGKVFGAFWMLFGCAALGGLIGSFTDFFVQLKIRERYKPEGAKAEQKHFFSSLPDETDQLTFFKQSLIQKKLVEEETIDEVCNYFQHLTQGRSRLDRRTIDRHLREEEADPYGA